jgi:transcriptional regulator with XRE-family HTH domain
MARKPAMRHVIADVRIKAGLSQAQLSKMLGCAIVTVQRIEQGSLAPSEDLAVRAQMELGVAAAWLLANDSTRPALTPGGGKWDKSIYEFTQGERLEMRENIRRGLEASRKFAMKWCPPEAAELLRANEARDRILVMLQRTQGLPKQGILLHRINKALNEMEEDFNPEKRTLEKESPETANARKAYDETVDRITEREKERLWSDVPEK